MIKLNTLGAKLKALRLARKLTQQEVADILEVSRATVSNYEINRRNPSIKELQKFAALYKVGLDYFGIKTESETTELLQRAKALFLSDDLPADLKHDLYLDLMKIYLIAVKGVKNDK